MTKQQDYSRKQKVIGIKGAVSLIILVNMITPLSTDLYLPAMPSMITLLDTSHSLINMTLTLFFLFLGIGTLVFGPLSDKYGRKPILLLGTVLYLISSFACALSNNIYVLIFWRIFQAVGAGACIAVTMAIVKDCFYGKLRDKILALIQTVSIIAPMVAPVLGAFILKFADWKMLFVILGAFSAIFLVLTVLYTETLLPQHRTKENAFKSLGRLFVVCKNVKFTSLLITYSLLAAPFMGYLTLASFIYIDVFGQTKQAFSYYFAINALISILGPIIYIRLINRVSARRFSEFAFGVVLIFSILLILIGGKSPLIFLLIFAPIAMAFSSTRPLCTSVLFRQQKQDTGSVSSLINSGNTLFGCLGMFVASIPLFTLTQRLGLIAFVSCIIAVSLWIMLLNTQKTITGIK